jgi:hypothetical protein
MVDSELRHGTAAARCDDGMGARPDEARLLQRRAPTSARRTFEGGNGTLQSSPKYYFVGQRADLLLWQSPTTPTCVPGPRAPLEIRQCLRRGPRSAGLGNKRTRTSWIAPAACVPRRSSAVDRQNCGLAAQRPLSVLRSCSIRTCGRSRPQSGNTRAASSRLQWAVRLFGRGRRAVDRRNVRCPSASLNNLVQVRNHEETLAW